MGTNIKVALKLRPNVENEEIISSDEFTFSNATRTVCLKKRNSYSFDYLFPPDVENSQVFSECIFENIKYLLKGYNFTIMAYGTTGSGKTYTMGTSCKSKKLINEVGIIQLSIEELFKQISNLKADGTDISVKVSYLEIYKEEVYDLLQKSEICRMHDVGGGIKVTNLTEIEVTQPDELLTCLSKGNSQRHTSTTSRNNMSSRSHAVFNVAIHVFSLRKILLKSKFTLVDLAGSERQYESKTEGTTFQEGRKINTGLFHLGTVLKDLSEKKLPSFRNSKLTRLLQDSIGGTSRTIMIACMSTAAKSFQENIRTLYYASITRKIQNKLVENILIPPNISSSELQTEIMTLKDIIQKMKNNQHYQDQIQIELVPSIQETNQVLKNLKQIQEDLGLIIGEDIRLDKIIDKVTKNVEEVKTLLERHLINYKSTESSTREECMRSSNISNKNDTSRANVLLCSKCKNISIDLINKNEFQNLSPRSIHSSAGCLNFQEKCDQTKNGDYYRKQLLSESPSVSEKHVRWLPSISTFELSANTSVADKDENYCSNNTLSLKTYSSDAATSTSFKKDESSILEEYFKMSSSAINRPNLKRMITEANVKSNTEKKMKQCQQNKDE